MSLMALLTGSPSVVAPSYLINDNLEYADSTEATAAGLTVSGAPTFAYATAPAPLEGTRSLRVTATSQVVTFSFADQADVWAYMLINYGTDASNTLDVRFRDSSSVDQATGLIISGGIVRANSGGGTSDSSAGSSVTASTTYHFWFHYVKGTGANAVMAIYRSTDGIRGSTIVNRTVGTSTGNAAKLRLATGASASVIYDKIRVSSSAIGDNPT